MRIEDERMREKQSFVAHFPNERDVVTREKGFNELIDFLIWIITEQRESTT